MNSDKDDKKIRGEAIRRQSPELLERIEVEVIGLEAAWGTTRDDWDRPEFDDEQVIVFERRKDEESRWWVGYLEGAGADHWIWDEPFLDSDLRDVLASAICVERR